AAAPAGVMFDSAEHIRQHAQRIYTQAVQLKAMPIGNMTNMTEAERSVIAAWFEGGAK
ncbi:MAG: putative membrane protein, partial [Janthinobacterium sp.]